MFEVHCNDKECFLNPKPLNCNFCDKGKLFVICEGCFTPNRIKGTTWRYFDCIKCGVFTKPTEHSTYKLVEVT